MDQQNPNSGWDHSSSGSMSGGTSGSSTSGTTGGAFGLSSATDSGTSNATDSSVCPTCGQSKNTNTGLEHFLGRLGITDDMVSNLKNQFQNVDVDEYLNTARDFLKNGGGKASAYAKENPGKVAAGVTALVLGAGLIYAATHKEA